ncbi:type III-A CRISPR-associated protein Csm2 [Thermococcus sp. GR7]|uniref:type III-A CRISPR-associated protein Csm2 n=1 Tax=unclassified Thermococcus TaxID=2627626 RepID=UPI001430A7D2|nr:MULTISPECIES: type III-A CRISPR-associated protein Csm2 [unclassified Thermococcus]NJE47539.1 type III-A CRISPR-associated protein Csm2 [Thermococcus sp. GR7]NJE79528.1 type III-A CRISPR-associated protein Csm2 [Thermococcus sp. GR4]NJF22505.1 type III-A CRISPR-associated protein Csm2 [Thermococcus sp. GR5]
MGYNQRRNRNFEERRYRQDTTLNNRNIEEVFEKFNNLKFWELQSSIRGNKEAINEVYKRIRSRFASFSEWDEKEMLRNAAIVAAKAVVDDVHTTQVRKIIEMAKDVHIRFSIKQEEKEENVKKEIQSTARRMMMLLAYTAGKNKNVSNFANSLQPVLAWLLENPSKENFNRVYEFFEAIISYHRYFGGKE